MMKKTLVSGFYTTTKTQQLVDWMIKCGWDKTEAQSILGTEWTYRLEEVDDVTLACVNKCPQLGISECWNLKLDGIEREYNSALFGGKAKLCFTKDGENRYKGYTISEKYGRTEWFEEYSGDTYYTELTNNGNTCRENCKRVIETSGLYEYERDEGMEKQFEKEGYPPAFYELYKTWQTWINEDPGKAWYWGESFRTEVGEGMCGNYVGIFGEECWVRTEEFPEADKSYVLTNPGYGKYHAVFKVGKAKKIDTYDYFFKEDGISMIGTGSTGATCKIWMKRLNKVFGKWALVTQSGAEEVAKAQGFPDGLTAKLEEEGAIMEIKSMGGDKAFFNNNSKIMPMKFHFKWDEECTLTFAGQSYTFVNSLKGLDTVVGTSKSGNCGTKCSTTTEMKCGKEFMTITEKVVGTDIVSKSIFKRVQ